MDTLLVQDPRTRIVEHTAKEHIIVKGGTRVTEYTQTSNSYSQNSVNWSFQPPSTKMIVDRKFLLRTYIRVTPVGTTFNIGTDDALRQFPLASIMGTLDVKLNGGSLSDNVADRIHAMMTYNNDVRSRNGWWSQSPCMPDAFQQLDDYRILGSGKCPLKDYGENSQEDTRGGFPYTITPGDANSRDYVLTEPLFMSPLSTNPLSDEEGFVNINQIDIQIRWVSELNRIFTHALEAVVDPPLPPLTDVIVTFYQAPELLIRYITPDQNQPLPALQVLPYYKYNDFPKQPFTLQPQEERTVTSDTLKFNQIPRKIMMFARRSRGSSNFLAADAFANIKNISILWNNESNLLTSATEQQLFQISKRNGSNLTYSQWHEYRGSVFMGEFGTDIGLIQGLSPGVMGQYTLQATVVLKNTNSEPVEYEFFLTTVLEGSVELTENSLAVNLGNITVDAVEQAQFGPEVAHAHAQDANGGGFFTDMKHFFNKLSRGVQTASQVAGAIAPGLSMINPALGAAVGTGANIGGQIGGMGRQLTGGALSGGSMSGGRLPRRYKIGRY